MRYFSTSNATRPYKTSGVVFEFEPVELTGAGLWYGAIELEDEPAALLASAAFPQVTEITPSEYAEVKKKIQDSQTGGGFPKPVAVKVESQCASCGASHPYQIRNR